MTSPVDDPLNKILMELPVPGDDMLAQKNVTLTLDLIQQTRDNLGEFCCTYIVSLVYGGWIGIFLN